MNTHRHITNLTLSLFTTIAMALAICGAAQARQDPGSPAHPANSSCLLERLGTQLVRCDDLTGNGVPAPLHIPEQV